MLFNNESRAAASEHVAIRRLTFDMRGGRQPAKPDVARPRDGRVRHQLSLISGSEVGSRSIVCCLGLRSQINLSSRGPSLGPTLRRFILALHQGQMAVKLL